MPDPRVTFVFRDESPQQPARPGAARELIRRRQEFESEAGRRPQGEAGNAGGASRGDLAKLAGTIFSLSVLRGVAGSLGKDLYQRFSGGQGGAQPGDASALAGQRLERAAAKLEGAALALARRTGEGVGRTARSVQESIARENEQRGKRVARKVARRAGDFARQVERGGRRSNIPGAQTAAQELATAINASKAPIKNEIVAAFRDGGGMAGRLVNRAIDRGAEGLSKAGEALPGRFRSILETFKGGILSGLGRPADGEGEEGGGGAGGRRRVRPGRAMELAASAAGRRGGRDATAESVREGLKSAGEEILGRARSLMRGVGAATGDVQGRVREGAAAQLMRMKDAVRDGAAEGLGRAVGRARELMGGRSGGGGAGGVGGDLGSDGDSAAQRLSRGLPGRGRRGDGVSARELNRSAEVVGRAARGRARRLAKNYKERIHRTIRDTRIDLANSPIGRRARKYRPAAELAGRGAAGAGRMAGRAAQFVGTSLGASPGMAAGLLGGGALIAAIPLAGTALAMVTGVATGLGKSFEMLTGRVQKTAQEMAPFSAELQLANARLRVAQMQFQMRRAREMGGEVAVFQESLGRIDLATERIKDSIVNAALEQIAPSLNAIATTLEVSTPVIIEILKGLAAITAKGIVPASGTLATLNRLYWLIRDFIDKDIPANDIFGIFMNEPDLGVFHDGQVFGAPDPKIEEQRAKQQGPFPRPNPDLIDGVGFFGGF